MLAVEEPSAATATVTSPSIPLNEAAGRINPKFPAKTVPPLSGSTEAVTEMGRGPVIAAATAAGVMAGITAGRRLADEPHRDSTLVGGESHAVPKEVATMASATQPAPMPAVNPSARFLFCCIDQPGSCGA